jgi:hypothetical protein
LGACLVRPSECKSWVRWLPNFGGTRICDLLLDPPLGQARWVDRVDEAIGWLAVELVARWEVDAELEALRTSAA